MPITIVIDVANRVVITKCVGNLTFAEMREAAHGLARDPQFRPEFSQLVDLNQVSKLSLSFAEISTFKQSFDPFSEVARRAVAAPNNVTYGVGRMYESLTNSANFSVFRTIEEARKWLGLSELSAESGPVNRGSQ